jgi:uncharacterized protein
MPPAMCQGGRTPPAGQEDSQIALKYWLMPGHICRDHRGRHGAKVHGAAGRDLAQQSVYHSCGMRAVNKLGKDAVLQMIGRDAMKRVMAAGTLGGPLALAIMAVPAQADVRAGVDAWSRGDYAAAVQQWQGPAARGDADAQFNMGQAAKLGRGIPRDMARAEDWFHKAARQGHARAADNYGVLLFQSGRQSEALPWLRASADRGEPRAMYILGVAAFNGDYQPKDWVRAYALMTRAAASGLPQAMESLRTMNEVIPLEQRQMGASLSSDIEAKTSDTRSRELAAAELGVSGPVPGNEPAKPVAVAPVMPRPTPAALASVPLPPSGAAGSDAGQGMTGDQVMAGASFAGPVAVPRVPTAGSVAKPARTPAKVAASAPMAAAPAVGKTVPAPPPTAPKPAPIRTAAATGPWRVQLGAFSQRSNADGLWARVRGRASLAGHPRIDLVQGSVTRLLAGGFASQADAGRACADLKSAGVDCIVAK